MKNNQGGFIGVWSMDGLAHFNMMESRGLWIWKKCTKIYFWKMSKGTHLTNKHLGVGFTGFGVQMNFLGFCKVDKYEEMAHYLVGYRKY